ncbi:DUF1033 family protein [Vagococcus coleopterorum]|uniref:DUF1033 family protein n=1 Tax=Vagococcus coleopterorum TaxID=2714946 RepID=UPI001EEA0E4C|nr:DUF1033 family protein [Vagococcus coleopterorum]
MQLFIKGIKIVLISEVMTMYQVVTMHGENEPWWFFEDWRDDILTEDSYDDFQVALKAFEKALVNTHTQLPEIKGKDNFLIACWDPQELRYCDDCDEDVQLYHGILLLKDGKKINADGKEAEEAMYYRQKTKCCKRRD